MQNELQESSSMLIQVDAHGNPSSNPSSVLFVLGEGLYQCQVSHKDVVVTTSLMHVLLKAVDPIGTCFIVYFLILKHFYVLI